MDQHVRNVVRGCFYQLRQLRSVRRSLTIDALRTLAAAFVATRVDYCIAVLYGASTQVTRRQQILLNAAARLVVGAGKFDHVTLVLRDVLRWLPVPRRIQFNVALTVFDCVCGSGPGTSRTSAFRWPTSLAGQTSARLNVETWLCHGPELSSVGGASTLQHKSSGMPSLSTSSAQHPSVEDNSELV